MLNDIFNHEHLIGKSRFVLRLLHVRSTLNSKLVSYLTTTPASFVAFATTLMDWFRGQTIFRRRTDTRTGGGVTATSNQICVCSRSFTAAAVALRRRRGGRSSRGWGSPLVGCGGRGRPKSKFVVGKTVQMSPEHATRSPANLLPS